MAERNDFEDVTKANVIRLGVGAAVAALLMTVTGTLLSLVTFRAMDAIYHSANRALSTAAFVVSAASVALTLWVLYLATRHSRSSSRFGEILRRNRNTLVAARLATIVLFCQLLFNFIVGELKSVAFVQLGNLTGFDLPAISWLVVLGVLAPMLLLAAVLVFTPKWLSSSGEPGA